MVLTMLDEIQVVCNATWKSDLPAGSPEDSTVYRQHRCQGVGEHRCRCTYCGARPGGRT